MLYISSACFRKMYIRDVVKELAESGFDCIELSGGTTYYWEYLNDLIELKKEYNLNYQVHNYFPAPKTDFVLNLVTSNNTDYLASIELIENALTTAKLLGAVVYAFHPGYIIEMSPEKKGGYFDYSNSKPHNKESKEKFFYKRFNELLGKLPRDVTPIAIENLFPFSESEDFSLFSRPDEIFRFLDYYSEYPKVGLLLDLGHLNVSSYHLGFDKYLFLENLFEQYSHKIFQIHLSDNDGTADQHNVTSESSWQVSLIKEHFDILSDIPMTLEWLGTENTREYFNRYEKIYNNLY